MEEIKKEYDDQAKELRAIINELQENTDDSSTISSREIQEEKVPEQDVDTEINVLNLPPRKEVHSQKKKRARIKFSKPFIRLVIVVVLIIIFGVLFFLNSDVF